MWSIMSHKIIMSAQTDQQQSMPLTGEEQTGIYIILSRGITSFHCLYMLPLPQPQLWLSRPVLLLTHHNLSELNLSPYWLVYCLPRCTFALCNKTSCSISLEEISVNENTSFQCPSRAFYSKGSELLPLWTHYLWKLQQRCETNVLLKYYSKILSVEHHS